MCSTREARLASLRTAIDEVALAAQARPGEHADPEELAARLASLWAMIAELDPGLAARLRGYCPDTSLDIRAQSAYGSQPWTARAAAFEAAHAARAQADAFRCRSTDSNRSRGGTAPNASRQSRGSGASGPGSITGQPRRRQRRQAAGAASSRA